MPFATPSTEPFAASIGEIAKLYDLAGSDVLDELVRAGCRSFWWEGKRYDAEGVRRLIADWWRWDVTPEIELSLEPDVLQRLEQALGSCEAAESTDASSITEAATRRFPRKFVVSETEPPELAAKRRQQLG